MSRPYRYLITGILEQKTPLMTGGNLPEGGSDSDHSLSRDGRGRFTLRGQTLAGAMIACARLLYDELPKTITHGSPAGQAADEQNRLHESRWIFHHSHPLTEQIKPGLRDRVAISQLTGAARHGAKFDAETLPTGTRWSFLLEVDLWREWPNPDATPEQQQTAETECDHLIGIALNVLEEWRRGACWLGGWVAQGHGWMRLEEMVVHTLDAEMALHWPCAINSPLDKRGKLRLTQTEVLPANQLQELRQQAAPSHAPYYMGSIRLSTTRHDSDDSEAWGVDCLSSVQGIKRDGVKRSDQGIKRDGVKRSDQAFHSTDGAPDHWTVPLGQRFPAYLQEGEHSGMDDLLMVDEKNNVDKKIYPIMQGSSLRGTLRHALFWLLRKRGAHERDLEIALRLFGSTENSGLLLISDARVTGNNWKSICQEMHAEDEFTQGAYLRSKYNRPQLVDAEFVADYCLIRPRSMTDSDFDLLTHALNDLDRLGSLSQISVGGGAWKGMGWVNLRITRPGAGKDQGAAGREKINGC